MSGRRSGPTPGPLLQEARSRLEAQGLRATNAGAGESQPVVDVDTGPEQAVAAAEILRGLGFARVETGGEPSRFVAYDRAGQGWVEVRLAAAPPQAGTLGRSLRGGFRRRGLAVALLGPDGAGKSTTVQRISDDFYFPVRSIYMGLYQQGRRRPSRIPGTGLVTALARQWTRWLTGLAHRLQGRLVLFDRYTYDARLPLQRPPSRSARVSRFLLSRACPQPDLVVILDAPAEVLLERKGEHDVRLLARHREGLLELHRELGHRSVLVDATQDPQSVVGEVMAEIWAEYARRLW